MRKQGVPGDVLGCAVPFEGARCHFPAFGREMAAQGRSGAPKGETKRAEKHTLRARRRQDPPDSATFGARFGGPGRKSGKAAPSNAVYRPFSCQRQEKGPFSGPEAPETRSQGNTQDRAEPERAKKAGKGPKTREKGPERSKTAKGAAVRVSGPKGRGLGPFRAEKDTWGPKGPKPAKAKSPRGRAGGFPAGRPESSRKGPFRAPKGPQKRKSGQNGPKQTPKRGQDRQI